MGKKKREKRALKVIAELRFLTVHPSVMRGGDGYVQVYVCRVCGSMAWDPIFHDKWHQDQENK